MKYILLFTLTLLCERSLGQNIVPNPSFEEVNICTELKQPCSPAAWFYINQSPRGYYAHSKFSSADGNIHLNLLIVDSSSANRDYWQTKLLCPLQAGENYQVKFMLTSPSEIFNVRHLGFHFSNALFSATKDTLLQPEEYLSFVDATIKKRKSGWHEIQINFVPTENFTHLIIGNFSDESNQQLSKKNNLTSRWTYVAIDDIRVSAKNKIPCVSLSTTIDSLYAIKSRHGMMNDLLLNQPIARPAHDTLVIDNIEFDFDSAVIKNEDSLEYLKQHLLDPSIKLLRIVGFTDNSGTALYNSTLSLHRAWSVSRYLKEKLKIQAPIEVEGKGISEKYIESQRNRRVEIWIYR